MVKGIISFGNIEIEKYKSHHRKNLILLEDVDTDNILITGMVSMGEKDYKYFIGCKDVDYKIKPLCIIFPKTTPCVKNHDGETKWMKFLIKDDAFLQKYNDILNKVTTNSLIGNPSKTNII